MNTNQIVTDHFSNPDSQAMYYDRWQNEPDTAENFYYNGKQCGGCSFYAKFDADWGLCCHPDSRHQLETVFEHFTCPAYVDEGWDTHSFLTQENREFLENSEKDSISIYQIVSNYINANNLGIVTNRNTGYLLHEHFWPFKPDLGFIAKDRVIKMNGDSYALAPDLAIKIVTSFDMAEVLNHEVMMFLESGTRQVWVIFHYYPIETISVYSLTPELDFKANILTKGDMLDGNEVLPGFRVSVRDIFRYPKT